MTESLPFFPLPAWERAWRGKRPSSSGVGRDAIVILSLRRIAAARKLRTSSWRRGADESGAARGTD